MVLALSVEGQRVLDMVAERVPASEDGWVSGKRVRAAFGMLKPTRVNQLLAELQPTFLTLNGEPPADHYTATLEGFFASSIAPRVGILLEGLLQFLVRRFADDPDFASYTWDGIKTALSIDDQDFALVDRILSAAGLSSGASASKTAGTGGGAVRIVHATWSTPRDIEAIVGLDHADELRQFVWAKLAPPGTAAQIRRRTSNPPPTPTGFPTRSTSMLWPRVLPTAGAPAPLTGPHLRARLTNGDDPAWDYVAAPWNSALPEVETGVPRAVEAAAAQGVDAILLTAVRVEREAVLRLMKPLPDRAHITQAPVGNLTFYLGLLGGARVALTTSRMGSVGRDASILTLHEAIQSCGPRAVIAVGIAFGGYTDKVRIGDVLVSTRVVSYEPARKQAEGDRPRGSQFEAGPILLNRFHNVMGWRFERPDGSPCTNVEGQLLSGEKLVDDLDFKQELFARFPESIGGDMESAGIAAAAEKNKVEWIVVKAVSDWGDGTKGDRHRPLAAAAAASLVAHVVSPQAVLADLPQKQFLNLAVGSRPFANEPATTTSDASLDLYGRLSKLTDSLFERIAFLADVERSLFPPRSAPLADRVLGVAELAKVDRDLANRIAALLDEHAAWTRRR